MARIEVPMPQMGESIAEGTVSKWLKKVGDSVERDEPILEISTDKVDAEIPAPQAGVLAEVVVGEGETVEVGTVIAYIDSDGDAAKRVAAAAVTEKTPAAEPKEPASRDEAEDDDTAVEPASASDVTESERARESRPAEEEDDSRTETTAEATAEQSLRQRATPIVRRMAEEHGIDLAKLEGLGSGRGGRVTKQDLLEYLGDGDGDRETQVPEAREPSETRAEKPTEPEAPQAPLAPSAKPVPPPSDLWDQFYGTVQHPEFPVREGDEVETMDKVRRLTAEHMVLAKRIAPHVHSFIEIDFSRVDQIRGENKSRWAEQSVRVSFTAFVAWAVSRTLREFPMVNATASGNNVIYRGNVNLGIAVDLDPGLIVPVIRDADDLSLVGIAKKIVDLAERARARRLNPDEIQGGTFTITNPGVLGTLVGMPIIPKGTSGILGTGAIEKRVVVLSDPETGVDSIGVRKRSIFSLGYDHRIVDGADAARFLAYLKEMLEDFPDDA